MGSQGCYHCGVQRCGCWLIVVENGCCGLVNKITACSGCNAKVRMCLSLRPRDPSAIIALGDKTLRFRCRRLIHMFSGGKGPKLPG